MDQPLPVHPGAFLTWLLTRLSSGEKLTATKALNRAFAREVAQLRPHWFTRGILGPLPNREDDLRPLVALHVTLLRCKVARRYKGQLLLSSAGKDLLATALRGDDPVESDLELAATLLAMEIDNWTLEDFDDFVALKVLAIGLGTGELDFETMRGVLLRVVDSAGWRGVDGRIGEYDLLRGIWQSLFLLEGLDVVTWRGSEIVDGHYKHDPVSFSKAGRQTLLQAGCTGVIVVDPE